MLDLPHVTVWMPRKFDLTLSKLRRASDDGCTYWVISIFACDRWSRRRRKMAHCALMDLTPENSVDTMLKSEAL